MASILLTGQFKRRIIPGLIAVVITGVGVIFLKIVHSPPQPFGNPTDISSAAFFPGLMSLLLTALGIALLIFQWRNIPNQTEGSHVETGGKNSRVLFAYALICAMAIGLPWLGIWLTAMIAVPALALCFGEYRWQMLFALSVLPAIVIIHLFEKVMGIYFPKGVLF
jgi:hypothetical protein